MTLPKLPKLTLPIILFLVAVGLFFLGRWTKGKPLDNHQKTIDSLQKVIKGNVARVQKAETMMMFYQSKYNAAVTMAEEAQKPKPIYQKAYAHDTTFNNSLTSTRLDSLVRATFIKK